MSKKETTEKELDIDKEEFKTSLEDAIKEEISRQKNSFHYTIVVQKEEKEVGFLEEVNYRVFLNSSFDIPRKIKRDNWVSDEKEAFNHFYSLGFDGFQTSQTVGRESGNTYQVFKVRDEQVEHSMRDGNWVTIDAIDYLTDFHSSELESIVYSIPQILD
jgi:hypothetical protein